MKRGIALSLIVLWVCIAVPVAAGDETATPKPMVDTYDSLADAILATKQTEWNLVHTILANSYRHAEGLMRQSMAAIESGGDAKASIEALATLVAQIGNEGDASVAAVRKRLLDEYGIEIGAGLGAFKGKAWRIGLMGSSATRRNVRLAVTALRDVLA